jgi:glyceraldehyde-3-phosphate dehydrogenase (NADP+)
VTVRSYDLLVGAKWQRGADTIEIRSPWDAEVVARVAQAGPAEIEAAIAAAAAAAEPMRAATPLERARLLREIARRVGERAEELGEMICLEAGKPIQYARGEAERAVETFEQAAVEAQRPPGEMIALDTARAGKGRVGLLRRVPRGPATAITPFNFPLNLVAHKVAPALACGCPVVVKPAPETPTTAMMLAEIVEAAGAPPGALAVVPAPVDVIGPLIDDPRMKMLSFTGSAGVGWQLKARAGRKQVTLELGGNAAVIVEPDADLDAAIPRIAMGAFAYAGQICISVQRILVAESVVERVTQALVAHTRELGVGDPRDPKVMVGPLLRARDADRVSAWIDEARAAGARVLCGGSRRGNVIDPTILADVPAQMRISCQEVFGPVVVLASYRDFDDALAAVNDSDFGLQCGVYTRDVGKLWRAYERLEVGAVIHDDVPLFRADHMPYGGVKGSGFGREGPRYAIEAMTEPRLLVLRP